jgi:hypothetical protein
MFLRQFQYLIALEQNQKIVTDSYQQLIAQLARAIADDRPLPAITDTLDSGTGTGCGDSITISHQATRGHILSN